MSMTKVIPGSSWDYGMPVVSMLKVSSRGIRGSDLSDLVKRAGHHFADKYRDFKCAKDQVPLHVLAMGATEAWGPNRNGDGFKEACLKKYGHTFITDLVTKAGAFWYRNHQNKDPRKSYGIVKDSWYNPDMRRQELIILLNATKEAAERHGGLVADKELEKVARGEDIPVSMACRVPFDKCAYCGNEARTRAEYCTDATCGGGGCRDNLARVVKIGNDMFHMHVDNPHPGFFDISDVFRGADRTAHGGLADYIQKAASAGMGGAQLAEMLGVTSPFSLALNMDTEYVTSESTRNQVKLAYGLAALAHEAAQLTDTQRRAFSPQLQPPMDLKPITSEKTAQQALAALADEHIVMKLADFARLTGRTTKAADATRMLPEIHGRLAERGDLVRAIESNPYAPSEQYPSEKLRVWAKHAAETYSLKPEFCRQRAMRSSIRGQDPADIAIDGTEKVAWDGVDAEAEKLASDYALYQVAALARIAGADVDFPLTARQSSYQNYVS